MQRILKGFLLAVISMFVLSVGTNMLHELGHAFACTVYGHEFEIVSVGLGTNITQCFNDDAPSERFFIGVMGGLVGAVASIILFIFVNVGWFRAVAIALVASHGMMAIVESSPLRDWYTTSDTATTFISGIFLLVFIIGAYKWILKAPETKTEVKSS